MKKRLLFLSALIVLSLTTFGQAITLTVSDIASIGAAYDQRTDTAHIVVPGNAGTNVTWDMSGLTSGTGLNINLTAENPSTLPSGPRFVTAGANIAMSENDSVTNYYFNKTSTSVVVVGYSMDLIGNGDIVCNIFSSPDTMITLPSTYNTSFSTNVYGDTKSPVSVMIDTVLFGNPVTVPVDSVRIKHIGSKTSIFDGWGTLTTPNGSVSALRQQTYELMLDSAWVFVNYPPYFQDWAFYQEFHDTINQYIWWSQYAGMPLVKMEYDSLTLTVSNVTWLYITDLGRPHHSSDESHDVYPNPANEVISVEGATAGDLLQLYDITGKMVFSSVASGNNILSLSTTGLHEGFYILKISGRDKTPFTKKIIVRH